jgi:hypothetical protein
MVVSRKRNYVGPLSGVQAGALEPRQGTIPKSKGAHKHAVTRDRETMLTRLLRGEKLPERPFERLTQAMREVIAERAADFMAWRITSAEFHFE